MNTEQPSRNQKNLTTKTRSHEDSTWCLFVIFVSLCLCGEDAAAGNPQSEIRNPKSAIRNSTGSPCIRVLHGREKKCIAGFQPAKVVLTQKELSTQMPARRRRYD